MYKQDKNQYYVTVILSTYNGHAYISQQLDSLINQKGVIINLFVRDDGSKDDTVAIIKSYSEKFNSVQIVEEPNVGATASFHRAARLALEKCERTDYYAFCDQDDIWLEDKLISGIETIAIESDDKPNLYFSNLMMMNNDGELLGMLIDDSLVSCCRYNALAAIYAYGCTCIFNRVALQKFCMLSKEDYYIYHDNWMYAICSFLGTIKYDSESHIRYRQTGHNVSGEKKSGVKLWIHRINLLLFHTEDKRIYESIARALINCFSDDLNKEDACFLELLCNYRKSIKSKIQLLFSRRMKTKDLQKNICIVGRILINRL